jgi:hypothetical protein
MKRKNPPDLTGRNARHLLRLIVKLERMIDRRLTKLEQKGKKK